jgi:fumarate hydratase class I
VSCAADRQALGKITATACSSSSSSATPAQYLPEVDEKDARRRGREGRPRRPMSEIRASSRAPRQDRLSLSGPMVVARDIAHAKIKERLDRGEGCPRT